MRRELIAMACVALCVAAVAEAASGVPEAAAVKLTRTRPQHEALPTMRYLKANLDFVRGRLEALQAAPRRFEDQAAPLDPRFLSYARMLGDVTAARDSVTVAERSGGGERLFASVRDLGALESQLDAATRALDAQRARLAALEADFAARQATTLLVVLTGAPSGAQPSAIRFRLEDGDTLTVAIGETERAAMRDGAALEVFHGRIEPRAQVCEVTLLGTGDEAPAYVTIEPAREKLTCLQFAFSASGGGAAALSATRWERDEPVAALAR